MTVVDVHCHLFNASDLPVRGFVRNVALHGDPGSGPLADLVERVIQGGTATWADDSARIDSLLAGTPALTEAIDRPPASAQIDADAASALHQLVAQHPDLVAQATEAMTTLGYASSAPQPTEVAEVPEAFNPLSGIGDAVRAVRWATLFTRSRLDLAADYSATFGGKVDLAVPLMVDLGTSLGEQPQTTIMQQVELLEKISRASMLGLLPGIGDMRIHPFVAFDPLRELQQRKVTVIQSSLDVVKTAVDDYGFIGVKVYPQMGWRPVGNTPRNGLSAEDCAMLDSIVEELAAWCEAEDVPLVAHGNSSNYASPAYDGMGAPEQWLSVLDKHPGLHLNLGHCGGAHADTADYGWADTIIAGLEQYPNLFGDVGCDHIDDTATRARYTQYLKDAAAGGAPIADRLMFGTDWYMEALNKQADQFLNTYTKVAVAAFGDQKQAAFLSDNALRFLGFGDPDNQNNQRLQARYQQFAPARIPAWL